MKTIKASRNEIKHSSRGIFQYANKKPVRMLKGGHGERNIGYLKKNKLSYKVNKVDSNGVRHGQILCHVRRREQSPGGHVWFPTNWSDATIRHAGEHVANLKRNTKKKDHSPMYGKFKNVDVVTYKSRGRICGICPKFIQEK
ncbi:MAG: EndoU domain-containing protein [Clostridia bacterium]|nr:EndoU domain-containing protein [Clostridia bacterium]